LDKKHWYEHVQKSVETSQGSKGCSFCRFQPAKRKPPKPAAPKLQHTTNWEQNDRCVNSATQSQAPDDGYINVRNML